MKVHPAAQRAKARRFCAEAVRVLLSNWPRYFIDCASLRLRDFPRQSLIARLDFPQFLEESEKALGVWRRGAGWRWA